MYPTAVAHQLRDRGHDVLAVSERIDLRSLLDAAVFDSAQHERRAVMTENVGDFVVVAGDADQRGQRHHGLVLIDPAEYPRGHDRTLGRLVTALDQLLLAHIGEEPTSVRHWL